MNKKILFLISCILIVLLCTTIIIYKKNSSKKVEDPIIEEDNSENTDKTVEEIKQEIGATADEDLYEVQKEYDGREILVIKPDAQYKTVLAGILKNGEPTEQDIEKLDLSNFHKGIWISETSREKFLQILEKCKIENFKIDEDGYLVKIEESSNEYSLRLEEIINSETLTVIDIKGTCYIRDDMTGEIVEYPFKDMDLYQICEIFETEGSKIIILTTNDVEEIDMLKAICD